MELQPKTLIPQIYIVGSEYRFQPMVLVES